MGVYISMDVYRAICTNSRVFEFPFSINHVLLCSFRHLKHANMNINFPVILLAALACMPLGFLWYGPLFGKAWMRESGMTPEKAKSSNLVKILSLSYLFCVMLAFSLQFMVIHQYSVYSLIEGLSGEEADMGKAWVEQGMQSFGTNFRSFKHGVLHGFLAGLTLALPLVGMNSLYEQRSARYIFIHAGYWIVSMMLMGGIICQWA